MTDLIWADTFDGTKANTPFGEYQMTQADSLGKHEIYFEIPDGDKVFVGYERGEAAAMEKSQKHFDWLSTVHNKEQSDG